MDPDPYNKSQIRIHMERYRTNNMPWKKIKTNSFLFYFHISIYFYIRYSTYHYQKSINIYFFKQTFGEKIQIITFSWDPDLDPYGEFPDQYSNSYGSV